ncbi:hypothetical protein GUJ93_ZPchr0008g13951 [Zizania palustris]|uniref:Uncharacterized protein n=1 Tax=Zizania palustris TaxID=103762 RepID=A0A8J5VH87_ZIZPA|nr:hypothetical protein GUJ93_ZPchr0008g13951 [Zizania palustris]
MVELMLRIFGSRYVVVFLFPTTGEGGRSCRQTASSPSSSLPRDIRPRLRFRRRRRRRGRVAGARGAAPTIARCTICFS